MVIQGESRFLLSLRDSYAILPDLIRSLQDLKSMP